MKKRLVNKLKKELEQQKQAIENQLKSFAKKDKKLEGDWDSKHPEFNGGAGSSMMEDEAKEVEEYSTRLPLEYSLELRLKEINEALEKIKKGTYGKCEKCGQNIPKKRLIAYPAAKTCLKCTKRSKK